MIGTVICPGIGTIVGTLLGGLIGSVCAAFTVESALEYTYCREVETSKAQIS
jgi:hypothetical protein